MRGRKTERHVVSDWMDIERERGISVTSAAVEFDLGRHHLTLLDTPGHKDFSEDTYRTLFAVDGVVMVIDAAKGIESQTRKLFEVCKLRRLPVLTFINKLDLPSRDPFDLLDEIERVLGIHAVPMNWPIGSGDRFRGVYDLQNGIVHLYDRKERAHPAPVNVGSADDPKLAELIGEDAWKHLIDETSLVTGAGTGVRSPGVSRLPPHAGLLRQRAVELRPRAVPACADRTGAAAEGPRRAITA